MNSKSMHIDYSTNPGTIDAATHSTSIIAILANLINARFGRSELEKAQANYRCKQQRQQHQPDILGSLPIEEKLRLGMHRWID